MEIEGVRVENRSRIEGFLCAVTWNVGSTVDIGPGSSTSLIYHGSKHVKKFFAIPICFLEQKVAGVFDPVHVQVFEMFGEDLKFIAPINTWSPVPCITVTFSRSLFNVFL